MKHLLLLLPLYARRKGGLLLALFCALATVAAGVGLLGVSGWFLTGAALAGAGAAFNLFAPSALVRACRSCASCRAMPTAWRGTRPRCACWPICARWCSAR